MSSTEVIDQLIDQIQSHNFQHLYFNRSTDHRGVGWAQGLQLYSANGPRPAPEFHFQWLQNILTKVANASDIGAKIDIANLILEWGGMRTRIPKTPHGCKLLQSVIDSAQEKKRIDGAPMNSSYTKIAAVFGYDNELNTIWDSRVSTSLCFRLARIFQYADMPTDNARQLFPELGYVSGMSARVRTRMAFVRKYWPDVYGCWDGHFAGSHFIKNISERLNERSFDCPEFRIESVGDQRKKNSKWTPWKVNMVFFIDDIVDRSPVTEVSIIRDVSASGFATRWRNKPAGPKHVNVMPQGDESRCGYRIVNRASGIHFEPDCIAGELNASGPRKLEFGKHGLENYRLLFEFYRIPKSGNCKISARVRQADPCYDKLEELAKETGCPAKKGGIDPTEQTSSIFVFPIGKISQEDEDEAIHNFSCKPNKYYSSFLKLLPEAMRD